MTHTIPRVGDYVVDHTPAPGALDGFTVTILRITDTEPEEIGGGWLEQIERVEERAQYLAADAGVTAWRRVNGVDTPLPPASPSRTR